MSRPVRYIQPGYGHTPPPSTLMLRLAIVLGLLGALYLIL